MQIPLQWRHNGRDSVCNQEPHDCLLNRLFRRRSKKTSKLRVIGLCGGIHRVPVNSPQKWPVTRKMFPFDDVIMITFAFLEQTVLCYVDADPISTSLEIYLWYRYMLYANNASLFCKVCDIAWKISHGPSLLILQIWDHQVTAAQTKW